MDLIKPKRSARISPDRPSVGIISIILVVLVMIASMTFSFAALRDAARWTGAPEWALFLAPIYIDGSILAYTVALSIFRWRGEPPEAKSAQRWLRSFTAFSSIVNGMHAASAWDWDYVRYEMWGGTTIAVLAPVAALVSAEQIIRLVFQKEHTEEVAASEASSGDVASTGDEQEKAQPSHEETTITEPADQDEPVAESEEQEEQEHSHPEADPVLAESAAAISAIEIESVEPLVLAELPAVEDEETPPADPIPLDGDGLFQLPLAS